MIYFEVWKASLEVSFKILLISSFVVDQGLLQLFPSRFGYQTQTKPRQAREDARALLVP